MINAYLILDTKVFERVLKGFSHGSACMRLETLLETSYVKVADTYLSHFNYVKEEREHCTLMFEVNCPSDKGTVIR
jgi:hypothetical protein